jgi:hypothetical protein
MGADNFKHQVVWIDDIKPDFDFSLLHSNLTDGWTIERKNLPQFLMQLTIVLKQLFV